jgi:hypothetical protein
MPARHQPNHEGAASSCGTEFSDDVENKVSDPRRVARSQYPTGGPADIELAMFIGK